MKHVNIKANAPVIGATITPIIGVLNGQHFTEDQIYRCLVGGAIVHEVMTDGSTLRLDFTNYNKVNDKALMLNPDAVKITTNNSTNMVEVPVVIIEDPVVEEVTPEVGVEDSTTEELPTV